MVSEKSIIRDWLHVDTCIFKLLFICTAVTLKSQLNSELLMWCGKTNRLDSRWRKQKLVRYQSCRNMIVTSAVSQSSSSYIICIPWKYWHWWGNCMNAVAQCCDVIFNSTINKTPQNKRNHAGSVMVSDISPRGRSCHKQLHVKPQR